MITKAKSNSVYSLDLYLIVFSLKLNEILKIIIRNEQVMRNQKFNNKFIAFVGLCLFCVYTAGCSCGTKTKITKSEVLQAQKDWGNGLVEIGKAYSGGKNYQKAAEKLINNLYAYKTGDVLFKPTKASNDKFRMSKEAALSYFVGHNKTFSEDKGFALKPWKNVEFKNAGIYINEAAAMAMGKYFFTPDKGKVVEVEYTFGYEKYKNGKLKIFLHHSSLPYSGN